MTTGRSSSGQEIAGSGLREFEPVYVKKNKIVSAEDAVRIIRDRDTVAFGGFAGVGAAEEILLALEGYFLKTGRPRDLTLLFAVAVGEGDGSDRGLNHLAHEGLVKRIIGGHWGLAPKIQKLALENRGEALSEEPKALGERPRVENRNFLEGLASHSQPHAGDFIKVTGPNKTVHYVDLELLCRF